MLHDVYSLYIGPTTYKIGETDKSLVSSLNCGWNNDVRYDIKRTIYNPGNKGSVTLNIKKNCNPGSSALPALYGVETNTEMVAYIIYVFMGLFFVNVICLVIYCCKKSRGDGQKVRYKNVSITSDDDCSDV